MERLENQNIIEQKSGLIDRLIRVAKDNAIPQSEYDRENDLKGLYEHAKIHISTLPEFRMALEKIGMSYENLIDSLSHENAHGNKADELGAVHDGYNILCIKHENGYGFIPQVGVFIPDEWSDEKQTDVLNKIISAPEEYGNSLSPDDLRDLK